MMKLLITIIVLIFITLYFIGQSPQEWVGIIIGSIFAVGIGVLGAVFR